MKTPFSEKELTEILNRLFLEEAMTDGRSRRGNLSGRAHLSAVRSRIAWIKFRLNEADLSATKKN